MSKIVAADWLSCVIFVCRIVKSQNSYWQKLCLLFIIIYFLIFLCPLSISVRGFLLSLFFRFLFYSPSSSFSFFFLRTPAFYFFQFIFLCLVFSQSFCFSLQIFYTSLILPYIFNFPAGISFIFSPMEGENDEEKAVRSQVQGGREKEGKKDSRSALFWIWDGQGKPVNDVGESYV